MSQGATARCKLLLTPIVKRRAGTRDEVRHRGKRDNTPLIGEINCSRVRRLFGQRELCTRFVLVSEIAAKLPPQVTLVQNDHVI